MELLFVLLFRRLKAVRLESLQKAADLAAEKTKQALPIITK
jgi:hypothetical protein